jgi:hypothetical protein
MGYDYDYYGANNPRIAGYPAKTPKKICPQQAAVSEIPCRAAAYAHGLPGGRR